MTNRGEGRKQNVGPQERFVSVLAGSALAGFGALQRNWAGAALALIGGGLIHRGASGQCTVKRVLESNRPVHIDRTISVMNKSPEEVYEFWRNFENLPGVIDALESVEVMDERRSRWVAKGPAGKSISWDAEITNDRRGHVIEWRSLPGSTIELSGIVSFKRKAGSGTKVHLSITYRTPGGAIGEAVAERFGAKPEVRIDAGLQKVREALNHA